MQHESLYINLCNIHANILSTFLGAKPIDSTVSLIPAERTEMFRLPLACVPRPTTDCSSATSRTSRLSPLLPPQLSSPKRRATPFFSGGEQSKITVSVYSLSRCLTVPNLFDLHRKIARQTELVE